MQAEDLRVREELGASGIGEGYEPHAWQQRLVARGWRRPAS